MITILEKKSVKCNDYRTIILISYASNIFKKKVYKYIKQKLRMATWDEIALLYNEEDRLKLQR